MRHDGEVLLQKGFLLPKAAKAAQRPEAQPRRCNYVVQRGRTAANQVTYSGGSGSWEMEMRRAVNCSSQRGPGPPLSLKLCEFRKRRENGSKFRGRAKMSLDSAKSLKQQETKAVAWYLLNRTLAAAVARRKTVKFRSPSQRLVKQIFHSVRVLEMIVFLV